ncbi:unnamed protein product [Rodentolepis nana]|uniref:CNH domain-containing protein n=1 Tax=Rodentolepis nana TaxID=102285 RepID=A0A3P7RS27_RODNA|nr:unnamed protein product [Rodentolepis nana]
MQASRYAEFVASLSNNKLQFFDAEKLEPSPLRSEIDGVSSFSVRDSDFCSEYHSILAVCTMNQQLQVYRVVKARMDLVNTIKLSSVALDVFCVDNFAVIASRKHYIGIDLKTKTSQEIVARTGSLARPLINIFSEDEFLLSGPGSLGIFVNTVGQSNRPPLTLSNNLLALFSQKQFVFAVDDEFLTIHSVSLGKQVQTLVVQNASSACMSLDRNVIFIASHNPTTDTSQIHVVQPETWDLVARRLISSGCLSEATNLLTSEFTKLVNLCNERPATSGYAKKIFNTRSKRVYTLMGLYLFENGQLTQSREFFEKSSLDIRELLSRYVDLLPRGYEFTADPALYITASSKAIPECVPSMNEGQPPPCNIYNLAETTGVSVTEFRRFLLNFLLENRRGRIFAQYSQVTLLFVFLLIS